MSFDAIDGRTGGARRHATILVSLLLSKHMTSKQRRMNVDATRWRRIDVDTALISRFNHV